MERRETCGRVIGAGCVAKERIKTVGSVFGAGCVFIERASTDRRVVVTGCVFIERSITVGRVEVADGGVNERFPTDCRVAGAHAVAGCERVEGVITLSRVAAGIASVRRWENRSRCGWKRKAGADEQDEKAPAYNADW